MKTMMMLTICVLMTMTMAKSDEKKTITPQEFGNAIAETPGKLVNFIGSEVEKTKDYQTKVWAEAKTKWPWTMFKKKD
jgi:hypothetical protein|tara:strand:- start:1807 stop:2040 length:234 start_codon:yes stop_codon:yes gene_type:complete